MLISGSAWNSFLLLFCSLSLSPSLSNNLIILKKKKKKKKTWLNSQGGLVGKGTEVTQSPASESDTPQDFEGRSQKGRSKLVLKSRVMGK